MIKKIILFAMFLIILLHLILSFRPSAAGWVDNPTPYPVPTHCPSYRNHIYLPLILKPCPIDSYCIH